MKRKYIIWISIVVLAAVAIGYKVYASKHKKNYTVAYVVARQDVRQTVLATGSVTSQSDLNLSFKSSGTLQKLNVKVGDQVEAGKVLASLDQKDANAALSQAHAALLSAQASYSKVLAGASGPDIDVSEAAVESAQVTLSNAKTAYTNTVQQQQVAVSNANAAMLNAGLAAIPASTNASTITIAVSGTYSGTAAGAYKITTSVSGAGPGYSVTGLENGDAQITRGVLQPLGTKGLYITFSASGAVFPNETWTVSLPNTQASSYLSAYNAYQASLQTQAQAVASAQGAVSSAQAALDQVNAALHLKQSAARPEDVAAAKAQIATAQAQVQAAQNTYDNNIITAPISGVVTSVDSKIGELIAPQKEVIVLLDQTELHVESDISESSIAELQPGQPIDMTMDAFGPDQHFQGQVLSIDPASTVASGVIVYRVISSIPDDQRIKPGMTANLTIIISETQDVLAVPNRLIKTADNRKYVSILSGGKLTDVEVQTGLAGDSFTEITSGLSGSEQLGTLAK